MDEWKPSPRQEQALERAEFEVLYGGARGGGKTDAGLVWVSGEEWQTGKLLIHHPRYRALVIRKNADDLSDWVDRANRFYKGFGVEIAYKPPILRFPSGAVVKTGHLKDDNAYTKYQGHEYHRILIEELTQIPSEKLYMQLISSCRSTVPEIKTQVFATTNPGNIGHAWVKKRWKIDEFPQGHHPFVDAISKRKRIYIPATVDDNPVLKELDPDYINFLESLKETDSELYKAWRYGDWNTFAGQYFKEWRRDIHVTRRPFIPQSHYRRVGGMDWGRAKPFCFLKAAVIPQQYNGVQFLRVVVFDEWYGTDKTPAEWSQLILKRSLTSEFMWAQCDNQIYNPGNDKSLSIFEQFCSDESGWREILQPASKDRIGGWTNVHNWLSIAPDGLPYLMVTPNCENLIRTIPLLIHDEDNIEDINSDGEDHAGDALRYMLKKLMWVDAKLGAVYSKGAEYTDKRTPPKTNPVDDPTLDLDAWESASV